MAARDFARTFGAMASAPEGKADQPKAEVWINLGYEVQVPIEDGGTETRFVSLPVGIALDTQKPIDIKTRSPELAQLQAHQNQLLEDLQKHAEGLAPGEETLVNLQIQIRRVKDPVGTVAADGASPYARPIDFTVMAGAPAKK